MELYSQGLNARMRCAGGGVLYPQHALHRPAAAAVCATGACIVGPRGTSLLEPVCGLSAGRRIYRKWGNEPASRGIDCSILLQSMISFTTSPNRSSACCWRRARFGRSGPTLWFYPILLAIGLIMPCATMANCASVSQGARSDGRAKMLERAIKVARSMAPPRFGSFGMCALAQIPPASEQPRGDG